MFLLPHSLPGQTDKWKNCPHPGPWWMVIPTQKTSSSGISSGLAGRKWLWGGRKLDSAPISPSRGAGEQLSGVKQSY